MATQSGAFTPSGCLRFVNSRPRRTADHPLRARLEVAAPAGLLPAGGEGDDQAHARDEAANVSAVGHAAPGAIAEHTQAVDELKQKPDADGDVRGHIGEEAE